MSTGKGNSVMAGQRCGPKQREKGEGSYRTRARSEQFTRSSPKRHTQKHYESHAHTVTRKENQSTGIALFQARGDLNNRHATKTRTGEGEQRAPKRIRQGKVCHRLETLQTRRQV